MLPIFCHISLGFYLEQMLVVPINPGIPPTMPEKAAATLSLGAITIALSWLWSMHYGDSGITYLLANGWDHTLPLHFPAECSHCRPMPVRHCELTSSAPGSLANSSEWHPQSGNIIYNTYWILWIIYVNKYLYIHIYLCIYLH